ncbi:MAG: tRNA uracil 4-sulfurtransferase ThiI [Candidatus Eiseniibacteriota bacterium]|jgi:thiamine biosynthesis protein ThiI
MARDGADRLVLVTMSSEIHIKSSRTRTRFIRILGHNLAAALRPVDPGARIVRQWDRIYIEDASPAAIDGVASAAARVFGVKRAQVVRRLPMAPLDRLAATIAGLTRQRVEGRSFAVRVRRRGRHPWTSVDAEREIGRLLLPHAARVDLTHPETEVQVHAHESHAYVVEQSVEGPDGLPMGVGGRVLVLLSGGFDSAVAAWMMMRRGLRVDFLHFRIDCAQSEHALTVGHELCRHWAHGRRSLMHVIDFQPVKEALQRDVPSRVRQVVLKQLMVATATRVAGREGHLGLVTGESLGQVSSQTIEHLAAIDRHADRTILRPLAGMTKQEIIAWARVIGTHDLSARAQEVCDLADGPVAVAARAAELQRAHARLPEHLVEQALESLGVVTVSDWIPGVALVPVVSAPPVDVPLVRVDTRDPIPVDGPVALTGQRAPHIASRLRTQGREVWVVDRNGDRDGDREAG